MKKLLFRIAGVLVALGAPFMVTTVARAAVDTCTWTGGGSDDFVSTAANWTGCDNGNVPESGDNLTFPNPTSASYTVIIDDLAEVGDIVVNAGANPNAYSVSIVQDGTPSSLSISGDITIGGGQNLSITSETNFTTDVTVLLIDSLSSFSISGSLMNLNANTLTFESGIFSSIDESTTTSMIPQVSFLGFTSGLSAGSVGTSIVLNGVNLTWYGTGTSYIGPVIMNNSILGIDSDARLGALGSNSGVQMTNSQINGYGSTAIDFDEHLSINGNLFGSPGDRIGYEAIANPNALLTLNNTTLLSDIAVDPYTANIDFAGVINGAYLIGVSQVYTVSPTAGHLIISAADNFSKVSNGDYIVVSELDGLLSDNQSAQSVIIQSGDVVTINGTRANVIISSGATLKGTGTVGSVSVLATGTLSSGTSPGCINTGNLTFSGASTMQVEINGPVACSEYDKTNVTGLVDLGTSAILTITRLSSYVPSLNTQFVVIENDGIDTISGTFAGLAQGATTTVDGVTYTISYTGGDGNDVVLTVTGLASSVGAPNTGTSVLKSGVILPLLAMFAAVGIITINFVGPKRNKK